MSNQAKVELDHVHAYPSDEPTVFNHLWARFAYTIIAWTILGLGINLGFFTSLILFFTPLAMDYLRFKPDTKLRIIARRVGLVTCGFWAAFGFIASSGVFTIVPEGENIMVMVAKNFVVFSGETFPVMIIWCIVGFNVFLTGIDPFIYQSKLEQIVIAGKETGLEG
ncbi:hypothetical protein [Brevibacillus fortis]|uniref:Uncharacterized protein n=1 Tax=Brevibacillus fortis TaxID=2126352 RepID=A0A2P7VPB9_9BACL|nr:hypothetical protein [Brevibacillus fortis]PSK01067.1 hypothetical protein C7R93_01120 [Brevibacillus fortis]